MRITKFGHACVRLEVVTPAGTSVVVIDPGMFTSPEALEGADAVLVTHEHPDHYTPELLASTDAPIFTIDAVATKVRGEAPEVAERITLVAPGEAFTAAGVAVTTVGELHAVIHPEFPRFHNSGYLLTEEGGATAFHPGDALTAPDGIVPDVLFAPVSAPWAKASELIDFARSVGAPHSVAIHDRIYSDAGSAIFDNQIKQLLAEHQTYTRLADGADL
ncbi:MAG: MBL fold metallo-hydrolase [Nocardioides sp.]|uniref:MBL fold metallo-hydrolase n=1 Tax=Nocardioides sp. TaxID=35761 RepID=UPI0039E223F8